jgi:hypothetical protein
MDRAHEDQVKKSQDAPVKTTVQEEGIGASTILLPREHVKRTGAKSSSPDELTGIGARASVQ